MNKLLRAFSLFGQDAQPGKGPFLTETGLVGRGHIRGETPGPLERAVVKLPILSILQPTLFECKALRERRGLAPGANCPTTSHK